MVLGFVFSEPFGDQQLSAGLSQLKSSISIIPFYMLYSFPVILVYGVVTSMISDKVGEFVSVKAVEKKLEWIVSGAMHLLFGLILYWLSLGASILFFVTDRLLRKQKEKYSWKIALSSLLIPFMTWLGCMGFVWWMD